MTSLRNLALCAVAASTAWLAASGAAMPADESGMRQFMLQDALRRQGIDPNPRQARPAPTRGDASSQYSVSIGQRRTYCVRTCDGYYFAIGFAHNKAQLAEHESMCAASCGEASMKLFTAPQQTEDAAGRGVPAIERATDDAGALYTALPAAYAFKTTDTSSCACKSTASGLPQIPMSIDPTLRNGDIIVTQDGLKVFRGNPVAPHTAEDFISIASAKSLPTIVRDQMMSLESRISE
jgi:hypothetical protein